MVVDAAGLDVSGPANDERYTDATFGARTLGAAQKAVAVEERGIGSSFFVRAVVAGEDDDGVVIESLFLELARISPT